MKKITTSDLRLGNWLYDSQYKGFPMQVEGIGKDWIYLNFEENEGEVFENTDKEIYPIPITKDLLLHLANDFEDVKNGYGIELGKDDNYFGVRMEDIDGVFVLIPTVNCDEYDIGETLYYVHELQNLYHALTGKELEIKREWLLKQY
jgi:hypothetical protein